MREKAGSLTPPLFPHSTGEVPGTAGGWWVPSEGDGVRVCVHFRHVSRGKP